MKNVLTMMLFLTVWIGAQANHEKATLIIKTNANEHLEVKVNGKLQTLKGNQYHFSDLAEGNQQVTIHKIVSSGYNQPTKKKLLYKGNLAVYKGMATTYLLDKNVMRFQEKKAIPNQNGNNAHWHGGHPSHPTHPHHPKPPTCGTTPPPQHWNSCNCGNHGWNGYQPNNYCNYYNQFGHCNNNQCSYSGCQNYHNPKPYWGSGYQNNGNNWNGGWNYGNYYNNGYGNYNYGHPNSNGYNQGYYNPHQNYYPNGYKQPMNSQRFKSFMDQLQDEFMDNDKVKLAKQKLDKEAVTVNQVKAIIQEVYFESNKLEIAKYLHSRTVDQQNYGQINKLFTYTSSKNSLNNFINKK